jgi:hypothetical protein
MKDSEEVKAKRNASVSIGKKAEMASMTPEERKAKYGNRKGTTWSAEQHAKRAATAALKRESKEAA